MIKAGICREHLVCIQRPLPASSILCWHPLQNELTAYLAAIIRMYVPQYLCVPEYLCVCQCISVCVCVCVSWADIHALKLMPGTRKWSSCGLQNEVQTCALFLPLTAAVFVAAMECSGASTTRPPPPHFIPTSKPPWHIIIMKSGNKYEQSSICSAYNMSKCICPCFYKGPLQQLGKYLFIYFSLCGNITQLFTMRLGSHSFEMNVFKGILWKGFLNRF